MTHREIITTAFGWWTAAGCRTYGASPKEIAAKVKPYAELLADVEPETLKAACQRCANTCKDFPCVRDVREAVEALRNEQRAQPEQGSKKAHPNCGLCDGTGWQVVCDGATRCRCWLGLDFPLAAERKQLPPAEFQELLDISKGRGM